MVQAARSGKQNIAEGYLQKSIEGKLKLLGVARGSLEELLNDYQDFLRQKGLMIWEVNSTNARKVRALAYINYNNYNDYKLYMRDKIIEALVKATGLETGEIHLETPDNEEFGDYSSNITLQ